MLCDFHLHTEFSGDSETPVRDQAERAAALGMNEICITDHHDYDALEGGDTFLLDFASYFPALRQVREEYAGTIRIRTGVELGLQLHIRDYLMKLALSLPVDFIIGSSHFIDGKDPYFPSFFHQQTEQEAYTRYFAATLDRVRSLDCFDVLGHLDYIVRYGPHQNREYSYSAYREYIDPILKALIEKGKGLECNTGGFKAGLGHPHPAEDILIRYRELGGEILTVGSDAHTPAYVGHEFRRLPQLLQACGFRYYTVFRQRKPVFVPL